MEFMNNIFSIRLNALLHISWTVRQIYRHFTFTSLYHQNYWPLLSVNVIICISYAIFSLDYVSENQIRLNDIQIKVDCRAILAPIG